MKTIAELKKEAKSYGLNLNYKPSVLVKDINTLSHQQWLESRQKGIGGSDAGAILGLSHFKNPLDIYLSKVEEVGEESKTPSVQYRLDMGHAMEPVILDWYSATTHNVWFEDRAQYNHPKYPWMLADCDGFARINGALIGLECKTTTTVDRAKWKTGVYGQGGLCPNQGYVMQVTHYMAVMNLPRIDLICAFDNNGDNNVVVTFLRDLEREKMLIDAEEKFWKEHVVKRCPPECDYSDEAIKSKLLNVPDPVFVDLDNDLTSSELIDAVKEWTEISAKKAELKKQTDELDSRLNTLKAQFSDALDVFNSGTVAMNGTTYLIKQTASIRPGVDTKAMQINDPDLYEKYKKETRVCTVTCKEVKPKKKKSQA